MDVGEFAEAREVLRQAIAAGDEAGDHRLRADAVAGACPRRVLRRAPADWSQRAARIASRRNPRLRAPGRRRRPREGLARPRRRPRDGPSLRGGRRGRRPGDGARTGGGRPAPGAPERVLVRRRGGVRADARARAIEECSRIVADATGDRRTEGLVLGALAHLEAMRGEFDRARELSARARSTLEELGNSVLAAATSLEAGAVELLAGNPAEAERLIRRDVAELERMGAAYLLSDHDRPACASGGRTGPRRRGCRAGRGRSAADGRRRRRVGRNARMRPLGPPRPRGRPRRWGHRGPARGRAARDGRRTGRPRRGAPGACGGLRGGRRLGGGGGGARPGDGRVPGEGLCGGGGAGEPLEP